MLLFFVLSCVCFLCWHHHASCLPLHSVLADMEFFPPAEGLTLGPQIFMMMVYGFILMYGSKLIGDGSDILLDIYKAGIVGGLLIPILGAVPDGVIILVAGMGSDKAAIQESIKVPPPVFCTFFLIKQNDQQGLAF